MTGEYDAMTPTWGFGQVSAGAQQGPLHVFTLVYDGICMSSPLSVMSMCYDLPVCDAAARPLLSPFSPAACLYICTVWVGVGVGVGVGVWVFVTTFMCKGGGSDIIGARGRGGRDICALDSRLVLFPLPGLGFRIEGSGCRYVCPDCMAGARAPSLPGWTRSC